MVSVDVSVCPKCGGALKYYGMVPRIVRTKNRTITSEKQSRKKMQKVVK